MTNECNICNKSFKNIKGLHVHVKRSHKLSVAEYYPQVYKRKDKYTGELLEFKDFTDYFSRDFASIENFLAWSETAEAEEVKEVMLRQLKARIEGKELKYAPCHLELSLNKFPTINIYKKFFGSYSNACSQLNIEPLYNKKLFSGFFNDYSELNDVKILIDTRERKPLSFSNSAELKLDFGDYAVGSPHYNYTYVDRKDESDFRSTMTTGFNRFVRELERAKDFDAFLFIVVEGSVESIIANNKIIPKPANLPFIWHNMRVLSHKFPRRCQFIFTGNANEKLFSKLDKDFYSDYNKLYDYSKSLYAAGEREKLEKINKKLWIIKKNIFEPAYNEYVDHARIKSQEIIPKLLVFGKKLWEVDLQYFIDKYDMGRR